MKTETLKSIDTVTQQYLGGETKTESKPVVVMTETVLRDPRQCKFCGPGGKPKLDDRAKSETHCLYRCNNCGLSWSVRKGQLDQYLRHAAQGK